MNVESGSHCRYQIRYHIVWGVKYSRKLLFGERITFLKKILENIGERYEYSIEGIGIDEGHVHVFAGAHPAISPAKLIQILKSLSAREMLKEFPDIKKFLWGGALWQIGYYVRTVSDGPLETVIKNYIEAHNGDNQKRKYYSKGKTYQLKLVQ